MFNATVAGDTKKTGKPIDDEWFYTPILKEGLSLSSGLESARLR